MNIQCARCSHVYAVQAERDIINVYATQPEFGHIVTKCPACGQVMRLFIDPEQVQGLSDYMSIEVKVHSVEAPSAIQAMARALRKEADTMGRLSKQPKPDKPPKEQPLPEPPREWLIELLDTLRHFGQPCDGTCREVNP